MGRRSVTRKRTTKNPDAPDLLPEFHAEPYLHLAGFSPTSALIAWGAFYFRVRSTVSWKLVDDRDLVRVHPPRRDSIGVRSAPYGTARVNVFDARGAVVPPPAPRRPTGATSPASQPDTVYTYEVIVNDEIWAEGERYDWQPGSDQGLVKSGGAYVNTFRTHPAPDQTLDGPVSFAIIGDFGVGIRKKSSPTKRQREIGRRAARAPSTSTTSASC